MTNNVSPVSTIAGSSRAISNRKINSVTNIAELFDALALDWKDGSPANRFLLAGDDGQFIRIPENKWTTPYYRKGEGDIPVESGSYSMRGFIKFESQSLFRDMFNVDSCDQGSWFSAKLTKLGYEAAVSGILSFSLFHPDIKRCKFLNLSSRLIVTDMALTHEPRRIEMREDSNE